MNLKNFFKVLALFTVVIIIAGVVLINSVNTERNKTAIQEAVLSNTGYELTIAGDMSVNFFPSLGLTLNDIRFRNPAHNQELASTSAAVLLVDVRSLLSGNIYIRELSADDFHINVYTDASGVNIWSMDQSLSSSNSDGNDSEISAAAAELEANAEEFATELESSAESPDDETVTVSFERIRIANASVDIQDVSQGIRYSINNLDIDSADTNIEGRPFDIDLSFNFLNNGMSQPLPMSLRSTVNADINNGNIDISQINFSITPMLMTGDIVVRDLNSDFSYEGSLSSNNFDVMGLLQTLGYADVEEEFSGEITSTQDFGFELGLAGDSTQVTLDRFQATLGRTEIQANGDVRFATDFVPTNVRYEVITSSIDFSPFTADNSEPSDEETEASDLAAAAPQPERGNDIRLPFDSLQSFNVLGSISIESITANDLVIQDVNLFTNVEDGVLDIELQPTSLYDGTAQGLLRVDSRGDESNLTTQLSLNQLNIVEFLPAISRLNTVTGKVNVDAAFDASGSTTNELLDSLNGSTTFAITENTVDIGLIKQVFTAIAALSPTGESIQQWPDVIQFGDLGGYILMEDGITDSQEIKLRMDNIDVSGTGGIDLAAGSFDYDLQFAILGPPVAQTIPINELYHDVPWPVDCSARFDDDVSQYCRPDFTRVREIFTQLGANALRNNLRDRITDQVPEELQDAARGILRSILN
jgi:AsmA protein